MSMSRLPSTTASRTRDSRALKLKRQPRPRTTSTELSTAAPSRTQFSRLMHSSWMGVQPTKPPETTETPGPHTAGRPMFSGIILLTL
nr:TPA_asm: m44.6 sORF 3 [Murid betaherpesvirus 1]DBA07774.1 TPA_asm: m44.6 sORF 3 [Murid betaherpesvirus 1]